MQEDAHLDPSLSASEWETLVFQKAVQFQIVHVCKEQKPTSTDNVGGGILEMNSSLHEGRGS
jgi:hypothetical protein